MRREGHEKRGALEVRGKGAAPDSEVGSAAL